MFRLLCVSALVFACAAAAGCGDDPVPTTPITPPTQVTENFTGTLNVLGAATHVFATEQTGQAQATISALTPDSAARVSFIFGAWNGSYCTVTFVKDDATTGTSFVGNASGPGAFCVRVSDIGLLAAPTDYEIVVTHF
jgi:hypothetical protein